MVWIFSSNLCQQQISALNVYFLLFCSDYMSMADYFSSGKKWSQWLSHAGPNTACGRKDYLFFFSGLKVDIYIQPKLMKNVVKVGISLEKEELWTSLWTPWKLITDRMMSSNIDLQQETWIRQHGKADGNKMIRVLKLNRFSVYCKCLKSM